ncbi:hypothetical protein LA080_012677 [Diaporthe eres]|nr:hypothetical protein LA080_012677 [Diaporthe eres]
MHALRTSHSTLPMTPANVFSRPRPWKARTTARVTYGIPLPQQMPWFPALCRRRVAQPPPTMRFERPVRLIIVHRSPSWRVCGVAFARCVFAGRFSVSVAAGGGFSSVATPIRRWT